MDIVSSLDGLEEKSTTLCLTNGYCHIGILSWLFVRAISRTLYSANNCNPTAIPPPPQGAITHSVRSEHFTFNFILFK